MYVLLGSDGRTQVNGAGGGTTFRKPGIGGIGFGNGFANQPLDALFFAAGPTPTSGVYGRIDVTPSACRTLNAHTRAWPI